MDKETERPGDCPKSQSQEVTKQLAQVSRIKCGTLSTTHGHQSHHLPQSQACIPGRWWKPKSVRTKGRAGEGFLVICIHVQQSSRIKNNQECLLKYSSWGPIPEFLIQMRSQAWEFTFPTGLQVLLRPLVHSPELPLRIAAIIMYTQKHPYTGEMVIFANFFLLWNKVFITCSNWIIFWADGLSHFCHYLRDNS